MTYLKNLKDLFRKIDYILNTEQKRWGIVLLGAITLGAAFETLGVSVIVPLIQAMMKPDALRAAMPQFLRDFFAEKNDMSMVSWIAGGVIIIYIAKNLYLTFLSWFRSWYSCKIQQELSVTMMHSYIQRGYSYFLNTNTSHLLRGVGGDVGGFYNVIYSLFKIGTEGLTALFIVIFILIQDFVMASIVAAIGAICVLFIMVFFKSRMSKYGEIFRDYIGITNKNSIQTFEGIKEILVMHREKHFTDTYEKSYAVMQHANIIHTVSSETPAYIIEASCISGMVAALVVRMLTGVQTEDFVPRLGGFAVAAFRILPSLGRISSAFNTMVYAIPSMNACYENVYEARRSAEERSGTDTARRIIHRGDGENEAPMFFKDRIVLQDITFRYDNTDTDILHNIHLEIKKGTSIALIGHSGAGKTTLADVLLGLLIPQTGDILVDGRSIYQNLAGWSKLIGFVPQAVYLTDDTIRNNVAFGIDEDKIDDEKVWKALEEAQLADFVRALPGGLDNEVGDRGIRISGGQRQRIAIARALYENPEILVLDEATSALDTETETAVMESINYLHGKKTLIIIAHRLSTIENCDFVYEVGEGKVFLTDNKK